MGIKKGLGFTVTSGKINIWIVKSIKEFHEIAKI